MITRKILHLEKITNSKYNFSAKVEIWRKDENSTISVNEVPNGSYANGFGLFLVDPGFCSKNKI